jgi:methylisocitrate lyase
MTTATAGKLFRQAVDRYKNNANQCLQIVGTINAYSAILAEKSGFEAIYLSGSGVATASFGLPDLGITTMNDVVEDARRITGATKLPLLVDIDTGFGQAFNIQRTVRELERIGVAAVHIEDQVTAKRCGHRPRKQIVGLEEMVDRIKVAVSARQNPDFVIMARTDALANEGIESALKRAQAYVDAGADMLFPEACTTLEQYQMFCQHINVPVLANITEFGKTPLFTIEELSKAGVSMALYPLSAFRAMSLAALNVYSCIKRNGTQAPVLDQMQTREELYQYLDYYKYEQALDNLFTKQKEQDNNNL